MSSHTTRKSTTRDLIFLSFRRDNSSTATGRLDDCLRQEFGDSRVFQDRTMSPGALRPNQLREKLDETAVLLVVIGKDWLTASNDEGRRLDQPEDWVHREILYGLQHEVLVVPVLLDGVDPPQGSDLPQPLRGLGHLQVARMRDDDWENDFDNLADTIATYAGWARAGVETFVFGQPPIVVNNFEDRPKCLKQIGTDKTTVLTAVAGIGGVGKSQLAAHYFNHHQRHFQIACWIDMRNNNGLDDYEAIAEELGLVQPGDDATTQLRHAMESSKIRWLMVFDNAENPGQLNPLLVQADNVQNIVTSRYQNWQTDGTAVNVSVFQPDVAARYLLASAGKSDDPDTNDLAEDLGYLPLALNLAGAFCRNRNLSFSDYRSRLAENPIAVLKPTTQEAYDKTVEAIWRDSLESADAEAPGAQQLVEILCAIDWTSIGRSWLSSRAADIDVLETILAALSSYSLIELRPDRLAVAHNMIAEGILADASVEQVGRGVEGLLTNSLPEVSGTAEVAELAAEPIRHLQHVAIENGHLVSEALLEQMSAGTVQLLHQGAGGRALHLATATLHEDILGPGHPATLTAKANLATSYNQAGRNNDAITIREQVLADYTRLLGPEDPATLTAKANLATSYNEAGRTDDAINVEEEVLADCTRLLGPEDPATLTAKANLATSYNQAGRTNDAITIREEVLADRTRLLGPEHPNTLTSKANLASSYNQAGRTNDAITIEEEVLADSIRILGPEHPDTLTSKANLATSYYQAERTDDAVDLLVEVIAATQGIDADAVDRSQVAQLLEHAGQSD